MGAKSGLLSYYFHSDYLLTVIHESSDVLNKLIKKIILHYTSRMKKKNKWYFGPHFGPKPGWA